MPENARHTRARLASLVVLPVMVVGLLASGNVTSTGQAVAAPAPAAASAAPVRTSKVRHAVRVALRQIGDRYAYGAAGPRSFDCSGLLKYSYGRAGFRHMPRTSAAQAGWSQKVRRKNLRRGDLMFFHNGGNVYHVAIFLKRTRRGGVVMLDSQQPGTRVHRRHPWTNQWFGRTLRH